MKQAYADVLNMVTVLTPSLFTRTLARAITPTKIGVTEITRWQWIHPLFLEYDHHERVDRGLYEEELEVSFPVARHSA